MRWVRVVVVVVVVVACGRPPSPAPVAPLSNEPPSARDPEPASAAADGELPITSVGSLPLGAAGTCSVGGLVVDEAGNVLAAATVVATKPMENETVVLTDENGRFLLLEKATPEKLDVYYGAIARIVPYGPSKCGARLRIPLRLSAPTGGT